MLGIMSIVLSSSLTNSALASSELVINGSFEEPVLPPNSFSYFQSLPGWDLTFGPAIELRNNHTGIASDGAQFVELESTGNSGMAQILSTSVNSQYLLSFDYSPRIDTPASTNNIEIYWDGVLIADITDTGSSFNNCVTHVFDVFASGSSTVLEFRAAGTSDGAGGNLDNVSVTLISIPEELFCGEPELYYNVINGTESSDYLLGTNSPDLIFGNGGNDLIKTRGDNNCIYAGDGTDFVLAANDGNMVYGGAGNDSIQLKGTGIAYGEDGDDTIYILSPSVGHLIDGGNDYDLCIAGQSQQTNNVNCEVTS